MEERYYKNILMVGISGGGWTTVLMAAVDQRINQSFPIAGSLPIHLRTYDIGDIEEIYPEFYSKFPYYDLYLLGSVRDDMTVREHVQISYKNDVCCFSGNRSELYSENIGYEASKYNGSFKTRIEDEHEHKVHINTAKFIMQRAEKWIN